VVTGGASGIGAATARMFADAGAAVAVFDLARANPQTVAGAFGGLGIACDVTDRRSVARAFADVVPHDVAVGNPLTAEEYLILVRMADFGGQFYSRENAPGAY